MAGTLYTSTELDQDGRQVLASDNVRDIFYYSTVGETWDREGASGQSWYRELYVPNDSFDTPEVVTDRWSVIDTPSASQSTIDHSGGLFRAGIEGDDGVVGLTSDGNWRLSGDFDIRLYIDWDSYYNEYRSISHTFLKVGYDDSNAVRITFAFDGVDGYQYNSEVAVNRDLRFFDWVDNGELEEAGTIASASNTLYFKITRTAGVIQTYRSTGTTDIPVGNTVSGTVFNEDLFVEFGVESKEFNRYRHGFRKFFVFSGDITPPDRFSSIIRGERQSFPERAVLAVEDVSLSIIDESNGTLWMRLPFGDESPVPDSTSKVAACNGTIYLTTSAGIVALDFDRDQIFRYRDSEIQVADEPIVLRNSEVTFRTFAANIGDIPTNSFNHIDCKAIGNDTYLAATTDEGVTVLRALASGVAYSEDGPLPATKVKISDKGGLYWAGYETASNVGELSALTNITAVAGPGTNQFNRSTYYGADTPLAVFGNNITTFDVRTVAGTDLIGVGTTEGLTFLSFSPGGPFTKAVSFGVEAPADNPFTDPSFEDYLGLSWQPFFHGFLKNFRLTPTTTWSSHSEGIQSMRMRLIDPPSGGFWTADSQLGLYQMVDLTGVTAVYFDLRMIFPGGAATYFWDFEVVVGETVLKSVPNNAGTFIRLNESVDVSAFEGIQKVSFRVRVPADSSPTNPNDSYVYIDNLRTKIGDPDYRVLPAGNANILETLLQYDSQGHKLYFSTFQGYGAIDLDDNSLDYFIPVQNFVKDSENLSADFSRVEDEV